MTGPRTGNAKDPKKSSFFSLVVRTVDRVRDRTAVVGLAFAMLALIGGFKNIWIATVALGFYAVWGTIYLVRMHLENKRKSLAADERMVKALEAATERIRQHRQSLQRPPP